MTELNLMIKIMEIYEEMDKAKNQKEIDNLYLVMDYYKKQLWDLQIKLKGRQLLYYQEKSHKRFIKQCLKENKDVL